MPHRVREDFKARHPLHVTLRVSREMGSIRRSDSWQVIRGALKGGRVRPGFRLVHFSVQHDHLT